MTQPSYTDLERDFGRMEGRMDALDKVVSEGFKRVEESLAKIDSRLDSVDALNSEHKGAWKVITIVSGVVSLVVSIVVPFLIDLFTGR